MTAQVINLAPDTFIDLQKLVAIVDMDGNISQLAQETAGVDLDQVVVIMPALNEELSLPLVSRDLPKVAEVFVVDNGCTDNTPNLAREQTRRDCDRASRPRLWCCLSGRDCGC